jgi:hypothetical protein
VTTAAGVISGEEAQDSSSICCCCCAVHVEQALASRLRDIGLGIPCYDIAYTTQSHGVQVFRALAYLVACAACLLGEGDPASLAAVVAAAPAAEAAPLAP